MRKAPFFLLAALAGGAVALPGAAFAAGFGTSDGKGGLIFQSLPQAGVGASGTAVELPAALAPRGPQWVSNTGERMILGPVPTTPALNLSAGAAPDLPPALRLRGLPEVTSNGELTPERIPAFRG